MKLEVGRQELKGTIEIPMPKDPEKAEVARKNISEAAKKSKGTPEAREANSKRRKKYFEDHPEACERQSDAMKKYFGIPGMKERQSETLKKVKGTPESRKKNSEAQKKAQGKPEVKKKQSDTKKKYYKDNPKAKKNLAKINKEYFESPGAKEKQSDILKKYFKDPEAREKQSGVQKKRFENPEERKNLSKSQRKAHIDRQWYGSVKYYDSPQYCEKWTPNLRERVRAFFGYICLECGTPQNGRKLNVHHVWYNRKLCCDDTPRSLVCLCHSCHTKTSNARGKKRDEFSMHFQEIIDTLYDGKCWMSKEEFKEFERKK